jgi:hypothetical protein
MKRLAFIVLSVLGACLMGCQNDTLSPSEDADFESVVLSAARFSAEADPTTQTKCKGKLTQLAAAVTEYISTNFSGSELKFAAKDEAGNVVVGLKLADGTPKGLLFDSTGAFKEELKQFGKRAKLTRVEVASLPASVTSYVAANYAGAEIKHAGKNEAGEHFVMLIVDSKPLVLAFNADGTFAKVMDKPMRPGKRFGPGHK